MYEWTKIRRIFLMRVEIEKIDEKKIDWICVPMLTKDNNTFAQSCEKKEDQQTNRNALK